MKKPLATALLLLLSAPALAGYPNGLHGTIYSGMQRIGGGTYTQASATWRVPTVTLDPLRTGGDGMYQWVGIQAQHLIQAGIQSFLNADGTTLQLRAFYECAPDFGVTGFGNTVKFGDVVTASVNCTANCTAFNASQTWTVSVQDITQSWTATQTNITCASSLGVFDFVIETNAGGGSIMHFSDIPWINARINNASPTFTNSDELYSYSTGGGSSTATSNVSDPTGTNDYFKICWGQGDTGQSGTTGYTTCPAPVNGVSFDSGSAGFH